MNKVCGWCRRELPETEFGFRRNGTPYKTCQECRLGYSAAQAHLFRPPELPEPKRRPVQTDEQKRRTRSRVYGISVEALLAMEEAQAGRCAICERVANLVVDHDHVSGQVRGLLCGQCNSGLGLFGDDIQRLAKAIAYLSEQAS